MNIFLNDQGLKEAGTSMDCHHPDNAYFDYWGRKEEGGAYYLLKEKA